MVVITVTAKVLEKTQAAQRLAYVRKFVAPVDPAALILRSPFLELDSDISPTRLDPARVN